jgi:protein-S-isoprenylcysteine O-methyltransferase Ste14
MNDQRTLRRIGEWILRILGLFVILEPVWMLLPFAGFIYGSVFRIETLNQHPSTSWLTHFVFPVLTLGWTGLVLVAAGFLIFLVGAGQIYLAKLRRRGLVTGGLYRFVRHPQYVALTLFGVGLLLVWGRAIMFIAFFLMMYLYYFLAKSEERICIKLFGPAYEDYRKRTSFILPGDRFLRPLKAAMPFARLPSVARGAIGLVAILAVCFGLLWLITSVKQSIRQVPFLSASVPLETSAPGQNSAVRPELRAGSAGKMDLVQGGRLVVLRGPYRTAAAPGFAERVALRLRESASMKEFLAFLDQPENGDLAIVFGIPFEKPDEPGKPGMFAGGPDGKGPKPDPAGPNRVRLMIMRITPAKDADLNAVFTDKAKRVIRGARIVPVDLGKPAGEDIVAGTITRPGPGFPGEERWAALMGQMQQGQAFRDANASTAEARIPGTHAAATLVLVRAPILRTRLDGAFAQEILDRLVESPRMREQLRNAGAGGEMVAVAFPRPGENWYREHHGKPQVSVFVMLAQLEKGQAVDVLFERPIPKLLGAFIADIDFKVERANDSVMQISAIGPRRDLRERWTFFLSGVGCGPQMHLHAP